MHLWLFLGFAVCTFALPTKRHEQDVDPDIYLEQYGYLEKTQFGLKHSKDAREKAIRSFQQFFGLPETGEIDEETLAKMKQPRCGVPDKVPGEQNAPLEYSGWWKKKDLTWTALDFTQDMDQEEQRKAFETAFKYWEEASALTFKEVPDKDADIRINFGRLEHGDGFPFDGPGGTLAHAFFPEDGRAHFDDDENWTEGQYRGTNLRIVAAHEFGHALGLHHMHDSEALMFPMYQGYDPDFKLPFPDKQQIQRIYGDGKHKPGFVTSPSVTTQKPQSGPDPCSLVFEATFLGQDGFTYVMNGDLIWKLNSWMMEDGYPQKSSDVFEAAPAHPDAAVYSQTSKVTYIFKGNQIWTYMNNNLIETKTVKSKGYPQNINAAIMRRDSSIVLISNGDCYEFDEATMDVKPNERQSMSTMFPGIPADIDSSVWLSNGYMFFFRGDEYYKFLPGYGRNVVSEGYPKAKAGAWIGPKCSEDGDYIPK